MDREAGIAAHAALISADEYKARRARGVPSEHIYNIAGDAPVIRVEVAGATALSDDVILYDFKALDGAPLPEWSAGAHLDIVVAPEYLRQYSMCGDPCDRTRYRIAVLREAAGRGGSALMHRIFTPGRKVFVSRPINHFALNEQGSHSLLMGGGIGITPMIAFAHRLHALGRDFTLHYSAPSRARAAFADTLAAAPWAARVHLQLSDAGGRADLGALIVPWSTGAHVYTCGPDGYMNSVMQAAETAGYPEEARHLEYFAVPELPARENHPFTLHLSRSNRRIAVSAAQSATDALAAAGVHFDVKCSDGICGMCKCTVLSGAVDHRDFVLSSAQRQHQMILCQSRAAEPAGEITLDL